jgi:hypothetical protein
VKAPGTLLPNFGVAETEESNVKEPVLKKTLSQ